MENIKLDIWDYKLIRALKRNKDVLTEAKKVWAERCAIQENQVDLIYLNSRLLQIAFSLNLIDINFIFDLNYGFNWKFISKDYFLLEKELNFDLILFSRLDSLLSLTDIDKIPGYEDFIKKQA